MTEGKSDFIEVECYVRTATGRAYGVESADDPDRLIWVPKSQCEPTEDELVMPEWLVIEKGLV